MLSSKEGFSFHEGLDMDAISDITGISFSKIDNEENVSHHSGSIASDNTELLLNQNFSLQDLDGNDSFLDSVSQAGEYEEHTGHHQTLFSSSPNHYHSTQKNTVADSDSLQGGISNDFFSRPIMTHDPHSFQEIRGQKTVAFEQEPITSGQSTSFDHKQEFSPKGSNKDKVSPPRYLTRKYPSDTNIEGCGRHSVIKHHSRISSVKPDITPVLYGGQNVHDLYSSEQGFASSQDHGRAQHVRFHPEPFESRNLTKNEQEDASKQNDDSMHSHEKMPMFDGEGGENFSSYERNLDCDYQERHLSQPKMGPVGNKVKDVYHGGALEDFKPAGNGNHEMLLGVKHDPDTNELYDDKVREGANLLSRIFGGDHNGSFHSLSSTSRGSEKSQDEDKIKFNSLHENRPLTMQKSLDSSLNNDAKHKRASPPRKYAPSKQLLQSSNLNVDQSDHKPTIAPQKTSQIVKQSSLHSSAKEHLWNQDQVEFNSSQGSHNKAIALKNNKESQEYSNVSEYIKNDYNEGHEDNVKRPIDPVVNKHGTLNYNTQVTDDEEIFQDKIEEFKRLELDMEEIHSRKKMAMNELKALEESLKRNKADIKSSDNLVEQYRWQATQTRSELMELEKTSSQLQEECNALNEVLEKSKQKKGFNNNEMMFGRSKEEIFTSLQERDKFKKDVELVSEQLKRERERAKVAQDDLREKIKVLEDDLKKQHWDTVENLKKMKERMNKERQKVRNVQREKLNVVKMLHDEMKELQEKEVEALRAQMLRESSANVEVLEEKFKREANHLKKTAENAESRIKQLEVSLVERNEEISKLRRQHREEKQKTLDIEKRWRSQLESERQDTELRLDEQERSCKDRENRLLHQQTELENVVEERATELRRSEERCKTQTEELQKIIESKNEEIKLVRSLVRQQEDSTRVLGERLRIEAREHVRNAVEKERQSLNIEKERIGKGLEEEKEKNARAVRQFTDQLEMEKESHLQTKQTINKLKQEAEELRRKVIDVHGERISGVQRARQEGGEELEKIKEKLHEFTLQAEKLEKVDRETAKAIYEECRKVAELVDVPPMSFKTPIRLPDGRSDERVDGVQESPTKEALASLRRCNNELRQRLSDMRKQMDKQRTQVDNIKKKSVSNGSDEELSNLQKLLGEKEEEIQRLHKEYGDIIVNLQTEKKKEQLTYKRTVAKLEQEFQKLVTANVNIPSSVRLDKRDIPRNTSSSSDGGPKLLQNAPQQFPSRSSEKTSSADLLKHLQDRVKKLRAENDNLKKSSGKETSFDSIKQPRRVKWLDNSDSVLSQSKGLTISQLGSPAKSLEMKSHGPTSDLMNGNTGQISRLKKLLASATKKDDLTLPQTNAG